MRRLKVGRPSDVWSLGCILYQMVYGQPPFQHLSVYQKMKAIPNEKHIIEFPHHATPSVPSSRASSGEGSPHRLDHLSVRVPETLIATMQSCLARNPKERMTIPALLDQDWLEMKARKWWCACSFNNPDFTYPESSTSTVASIPTSTPFSDSQGGRDHHQSALHATTFGIWHQPWYAGPRHGQRAIVA